ncbi:MAG: head-tail adaptor protein [Deltaproteobacteria bacterium]|nr:head-tail adaptor protein [Deltaproteobacteria bacterium]
MGIADTFNHTFTLQRATSAKDSGGATTQTWTAITTFKGHLRLLKAIEQREYGKKAVRSTHRLYCQQLLQSNDRILDENNKVYNVLSVDNPHLMDEFYQADVERLL